jgi:hypothetical protein
MALVVQEADRLVRPSFKPGEKKGTAMKRMATVITGAAVLVMTFAGTAFAQTEAPPPTTVVKGSGGGTAFTGGNVTTFAIVAVMLLVVGLAALFVARRRSASQA